MARIRSIKPEFWTDGKIGRLSSDCALFFIGLWTFADDFGFFSCDTRELSLRLPRWRPQSLFKMLCSLSDHGLIRLCSPLVLGQITSWEHQKIKDRRASKWNEMEIQWDEIKVNAQGSDRKRLGVDRSGVDRSGVDRISSTGAAPPVGTATKKSSSLTSKTWEAYSKAYLDRHKVKPVRNASVNGRLSQLIKRLGLEESPEVAKFYVTHNDQFYVRNLHPVSLLLRDAEKLRTEWITGKKMTTLEAKSIEKVDEIKAQFERLTGNNL